MTYIEEVRDQLSNMKKPGLEKLILQVFGAIPPGLKNNDARITHLLTKPRPVARSLGIRLSWWDRYHNHVYGIASILGTALAFYIWFYPTSTANQLSAPIDPLRKQEILDKVDRILDDDPPEGISTSNKRKPNKENLEPTKDGFELIKHSVVCDLRSFKKVPSVDQTELVSPVVQDIHQELIKTSDKMEYILRSHTSGVDVYSTSSTHPNDLTVYTSKDRYTVADYLVKPRMLGFNVSEIPTNGKFSIQVSKTFWNAFQNPDQSWVGIIVGLPTRSIEYLIVFPENKPFISYEFFANDSEMNRIDLPKQTYVLEDPQKRWLWWNIVNPVPGNGYNVDWEW